MRIAIFHNLPSGGGKRALYEIVRRLAIAHEVDVYTLSVAEHDFCDLRPHCNQHVVLPFWPLPQVHRPLGRLNRGLSTVDLLRLDATYRDVAERIDSEGYDIVFVQQCRFSNAPGLLRFLNTPAVYYCAEPPRILYEPPIDRPYGAISPVQKCINKFDPFATAYRNTLKRIDYESYCSAQRILTNSFYSYEALYRIYGRQPIVAYLGVDTKTFHQLSLPKQPFVLSVGAISPLKGYDFLIRSLALAPIKQRPKLVIVGNTGPGTQEQTYLEQLAVQCNVSLEVKNNVSNEELVRLYNRALVTVCASVMEPFGFSPLESMACGVPVVAVKEGGFRETIVHGQTGLLIDRNEETFFDRLDNLLCSPDALQLMRDRCRSYVVENWGWAQAVERIETQLLRAAGA